MNNIRKKSPPGGSSNYGGLYDRDGPIPVPDVEESDTDSAWALFQDSLPPSERQPVASPDDEPFEETTPAPLKP